MDKAQPSLESVMYPGEPGYQDDCHQVPFWVACMTDSTKSMRTPHMEPGRPEGNNGSICLARDPKRHDPLRHIHEGFLYQNSRCCWYGSHESQLGGPIPSEEIARTVCRAAPGAAEKLDAHLKEIWPTLERVGLAPEAALSSYRWVRARPETISPKLISFKRYQTVCFSLLNAHS